MMKTDIAADLAEALQGLIDSFDAYGREIKMARALGADVASEFPGGERFLALAESPAMLQARRMLQRWEWR